MKTHGTLCAAATPFTALALCAGLAACTGSLFRSKTVPPSVYMLSVDIGGSAAVSEVLPADLAVLKPRVRSGLETDRIAVLYPDRRLDYFAGARWSGPLDEVVQDLTVEAFTTGARLRNVTADASAFASGYWLEIDVADFQAEYTAAGAPPTMHVHLFARFGQAGDRRILGVFDADVRQKAADDRLTAIVDAYERAADAALAQIVANTTRTLHDDLGANLSAPERRSR